MRGLSAVVQVLASPRVRLLHDFLTEHEASEILRLAEPLFGRSPVRSVATDRRTSSTATLGFSSNAAVAAIRARISAFSGYDDHQLEPLQVRYTPLPGWWWLHAGESMQAHDAVKGESTQPAAHAPPVRPAIADGAALPSQSLRPY